LDRPFRLNILIITLVRVALNTMQRMVYPFLPAFGRGLGVDLPALSLALTLRSTAGATGPFLASVADSRGRKTGMLLGLGLFVAGAALVIVWPGYLTFLLALVLTVVGKFVFDPSMQAYIGDRVSYQRRGLVMAVTEVSWSLSFIAGVPLMGVLIASRGWQAPFPLLVLSGALAVILLARLLPGDPTPAAGLPGFRRNLRSVLTYPPAIAALAMGLAMSAANEVVNLVFGVWLENSFGLQVTALGAAAALIGLAELAGESLTAGLVDRLGKPRAVGIGLVLNSLAALALPVLGHSLPGAFAGLFFFYLTFEFTVVSSLPLLTEVLPAARATLMSTNIAGFSLGRALGAALAPVLFSYGIAASAGVALIFNLASLFALLRIGEVDSSP
jgi:DHA1 family inner membrane transport protein